MPIFAVIGEVLGAIGAAAGVTGAGVTAGMSELAGMVIVSGVAGLAESVVGMTSASKAQQPGMPAAPSMTEAQGTATEAQTEQRRSALAAGAGTNVTGGSGIILGGDISSATLVGST
jgi:hypothetical protein